MIKTALGVFGQNFRRLQFDPHLIPKELIDVAAVAVLYARDFPMTFPCLGSEAQPNAGASAAQI
jgi:hypothetical protein